MTPRRMTDIATFAALPFLLLACAQASKPQSTGAGGAAAAVNDGGTEDIGGSDAGGTTDTGGDVGANSCGNGVLENWEKCEGSDLRDVTCASLGYEQGEVSCDPSCAIDISDCSLAENCASSIDEDQDGALSCADSDCSGSPACVPGTLAIGAPCTAHTDCAADNGAPNCIRGSSYPEGYCSQSCNVMAGDCPDGTLCLGTFESNATEIWAGSCHKMCAVTSDCRDGYLCDDVLMMCTPTF